MIHPNRDPGKGVGATHPANFERSNLIPDDTSSASALVSIDVVGFIHLFANDSDNNRFTPQPFLEQAK